jgi:YjbR
VKMETVRKYALSLGEVTVAPHHEYSSFRVRGKIFVTVPPKEEAIHVFVEEEDREQALASYPAWAGKLLWGGKVRGLRITLAPAPAAAVKALVGKAYDAQAGKR